LKFANFDKKSAYALSSVITIGIVFVVFFNVGTISEESSRTINPEILSPDFMGIPPDYQLTDEWIRDTGISDKLKTKSYKDNPPKNQWNAGYTFQKMTPSSKIQTNVTFEEYDTPPTPPQRVLDMFEAKISGTSIPKIMPKIPIATNFYSSLPPEAINLDDHLDAPLSKQSSIKSSPPTPRIINSDTDIVSIGVSTGIVNEPTVSQNGDLVFLTWNWGTARSINGGTSFTFTDPFSDFFMCCDQDSIYSPAHDIFCLV